MRAYIGGVSASRSFLSDPDLAQHLNADPDPRCQPNADLDMDPDRSLPTTKLCDIKYENIVIFHIFIEQG
jgi:hypothetical protein